MGAEPSIVSGADDRRAALGREAGPAADAVFGPREDGDGRGGAQGGAARPPAVETAEETDTAVKNDTEKTEQDVPPSGAAVDGRPFPSAILGDFAPSPAGHLSPKGRRTRQRLLEGARRAFEKAGSYVDTRITDIVRESGVAYGSFYTYFDSKEQLFFELAVEVVSEMYEEGTSAYRGDDPVARIDSANRKFLMSYRDHAAMMTIIEQAAALYPELRALRRHLRQRFVDRIAANIRKWIDRGVADPDLDPVTSAHALVSMTDNFAYLWFVLGEDFAEETAFSTITTLWVNALGISR